MRHEPGVYEGKGDTELLVGKRLDGDAVVIVKNYGWSPKKDEKYELQFFVGTQAFGGGASIGVGETYEKRGFVTKFGPDFFSAFAAGSSFKIYRGDTLVDSLQLKGSAVALGVVDRCVNAIRAVKASEERERQRFAHIPDDPFAGTKTDPTQAVARGDPTGGISADDYPASALAADASGRVNIRYEIDPSGRISNCTINASSGNAELDRATCSTLTRRGRFEPARGTDGLAISSTAELTYDWKPPAR